MKKPTKPQVFDDMSNDIVVVHQLVEALDDAGLEYIKSAGLQKYIDSDKFTLNKKLMEADDIDVATASLLGGAAALMRVHWAIHDLMHGPADLHNITDKKTRDTALGHVPYAIESDAVSQDFKDKLNKVLGRK